MFSRKRKSDSDPAKLSPEALALLAQLQQQPNANDGTLNPASFPDISDNAPPSNSDSKAASRTSRQQQKDEKRRTKRRKQAAKARFSRTRYLREINGNATAGVVLWLFLGIIFLIGPFLLNTKYLLPETRENLRIIDEIARLNTEIMRIQPQLASNAETKLALQNNLRTQLQQFPPSETVKAATTGLINNLRLAGMQVNDEDLKISTNDLGVQGITGQGLEISLDSDFLTYWKLRNDFVRQFPASHVVEESIIAEPHNEIMKIYLKIIVTSAAS